MAAGEEPLELWKLVTDCRSRVLPGGAFAARRVSVSCPVMDGTALRSTASGEVSEERNSGWVEMGDEADSAIDETEESARAKVVGFEASAAGSVCRTGVSLSGTKSAAASGVMLAWNSGEIGA